MAFNAHLSNFAQNFDRCFAAPTRTGGSPEAKKSKAGESHGMSSGSNTPPPPTAWVKEAMGAAFAAFGEVVEKRVGAVEQRVEAMETKTAHLETSVGEIEKLKLENLSLRTSLEKLSEKYDSLDTSVHMLNEHAQVTQKHIAKMTETPKLPPSIATVPTPMRSATYGGDGRTYILGNLSFDLRKLKAMATAKEVWVECALPTPDDWFAPHEFGSCVSVIFNSRPSHLIDTIKTKVKQMSIQKNGMEKTVLFDIKKTPGQLWPGKVVRKAAEALKALDILEADV